MLAAHAFAFAWDVGFDLGLDERHAGRDETHVRQAFLHHHGCQVRVLGRVTRQLWGRGGEDGMN
jgi:hypothetical protein